MGLEMDECSHGWKAAVASYMSSTHHFGMAESGVAGDMS